MSCFNSQPPEGGWLSAPYCLNPSRVSTHSRPKAAGHERPRAPARRCSFNSQPPEGGWVTNKPPSTAPKPFQLTAARRRLACARSLIIALAVVSTHSRPKAAGMDKIKLTPKQEFQLTAARRRLAGAKGADGLPGKFQLTAARRRLDKHNAEDVDSDMVSTHSRPKAAGCMAAWVHKPA